MSQSQIVLLDNVDSFTYNLVDELRTLGSEITIFRNTIPAEKILKHLQNKGKNTLLLLSPGPGNPDSAGNMLEVLNLCAGQFPVLGICLGHQAIVQHYGGTIGRAPEVIHGKSSPLRHCQNQMFQDLPQDFTVARYHSLMAETMPDSLNVLARCGDVPMAVFHAQERMLGFQFHPESILTALGSQLLKQSIEYLTRREQ